MTAKMTSPNWECLKVPHVELELLTAEPTELHLYPEFIIGELLKRALGRSRPTARWNTMGRWILYSRPRRAESLRW